MKYRLVLAASFINILYERLWSSFWPAFSVLAAWVGLSLMNAVGVFGAFGHAALLALFAGALLYALDKLGRPFRFPTVAEVERRMERESALTHRPLAALHDSPAGEVSTETQRLWDRHIARLSGIKTHLRISPARPDAAAQDRHALRLGALLLLVVGIVAAGDTWELRLRHGFTPDIPLPLEEEAREMDIWITPPAYTRRAPVFLATAQSGAALAGENVSVPAGSILKARLSGQHRPPRLRYAGASHGFTRAAAKSHVLEIPLEQSGRLLMRHGLKELGAWNVDVAQDQPPGLELVGVAAAEHAQLKISYVGKDDYGFSKMQAIIVPEDTGAPHGDPAPISLDLPLPHGDGITAHAVDLTAHLHAGFSATLFLTAEDAAGHVVAAGPRVFILPERKFTSPLAQKLVGARKKLVWAGNVLETRAIAQGVSDIARRPGLYGGDIVVFMALNTAARRLVQDGGPAAVKSVQHLLWDVALQLEDGGLSAAARDLSESLQQLSRALENEEMSKAEMQEMLSEVEQKMQQYMRALAQELAQRLQNGQRMPVLPPEIAQKFMKTIDLNEMLRQLQDMSGNNPREAMRKMAEFLKNTIDNLDVGKIDKMREQQAKAMEALEDMQELIRRQQALMDKTGKLSPGDDAGEAGQEQQDLMKKLDEIRGKLAQSLPSIPENIGEAGKEMKGAGDALGQNDPRGAVPRQKAALDALQKGMDEAVEQMAEGMQQVILSFGAMPQEGNYGEGYDPLGRKDGQGKKSGEDMEIPDERERRRVQQIIRELRERSNDYQRPKVEREYIDRLLDRMD